MMACSSRLRKRARKPWRRAIESFTRVRMGAGWCTIAWGRTRLNLGIRWVYHQWIDVKGGVEKLSNINAVEY